MKIAEIHPGGRYRRTSGKDQGLRVVEKIYPTYGAVTRVAWSAPGRRPGSGTSTVEVFAKWAEFRDDAGDGCEENSPTSQ